MSHSTGIFTEKHVLVLTRYRLNGIFRLGMPILNVQEYAFSNWSMREIKHTSQI